MNLDLDINLDTSQKTMLKKHKLKFIICIRSINIQNKIVYKSNKSIHEMINSQFRIGFTLTPGKERSRK